MATTAKKSNVVAIAKAAPRIFADLQVAGFNGAKSAADERAILKKALVKGALPKDRARAYKIGAIAAIMGFANNDIGIGRAVAILDKPVKERSKAETDAYNAAGNRLTRRLKEIDAGAADARGRKRGAQTGPKAAPAAPENVVDAPAVPVAAPKPVKGGNPVTGPLANAVPPYMATAGDWADLGATMAAFLVMTQKKNPSSVNTAVGQFVMAVTAAAENLRASLRDDDGIAH
jgi:hypothetical protein